MLQQKNHDKCNRWQALIQAATCVAHLQRKDLANCVPSPSRWNTKTRSHDRTANLSCLFPLHPSNFSPEPRSILLGYTFGRTLLGCGDDIVVYAKAKLRPASRYPSSWLRSTVRLQSSSDRTTNGNPCCVSTRLLFVNTFLVLKSFDSCFSSGQETTSRTAARICTTG